MKYGIFENVTFINETLEYRLTKPFSSKSIRLYHASKERFDMVKPYSVNSGTRLSKPRRSSFWSTDPRAAKSVCAYLFFYKPGEVAIDCKTNTVYISREIAEKYRNKILFLYEANIPTKYVGRGHDINIEEYSIDIEVIPDKVTHFNPIDEGICKVYSKEEIRNIISKYGHSRFNSRTNKNAAELLIYHTNMMAYDKAYKDINKGKTK